MQVVFEVDPLDAQRDVYLLQVGHSLDGNRYASYVFTVANSPSVPAPGEGEGVLEVRSIQTW